MTQANARKEDRVAFLDTAFGHLLYEFEAAGERPVLVLSNSLGTNLSMWEPQMARFGECFNLLRMDTRGHGGSSASPNECTIAELANDVLAVLDHLKLRSVCFCGISMGGMIGQWMGIHAAERVDALVLSNTAAKIGNAEMWNQRVALVAREGMGPVAEGAAERWFTREFAREHPDVVERAIEMIRMCEPEGYAHCCAALRDADFRENIRNIRTPTLVVFGTEDPVTSGGDAEFLAREIAGARTLALHAAHLSNLEAADAFTNGVLEFLLPKRRRVV